MLKKSRLSSGWLGLIVGLVLIGSLCLPSLAQTQTWRSLSNVVWGQGLPAFSYPFSKTSLVDYDGGVTKQVGTYNFPVSKGMAGVYMTLEPGAIRELHWHANAAEWAYVIEGRTRITLTNPEGEVQIADVEAGGLWYFPRGWGHSIEGIGPGTAKFLLVFNDGTFSEGATFSITDWLSHTPIAWVQQNFGWSQSEVEKLPKKQVYISRYSPQLQPLNQTQSRNLNTPKIAIPYTHNLLAEQPRTKQDGSSLRLASAKEFPASFNMAGAILRLEPGAMRQLHWHPNADEWQYVLNGSMDLAVFASEGKASMSRLQKGDVGYVPKGYGHALRNSSDQPLEVLIVFNDGNYQSIDLNDWIASNPNSVLENVFQISPQLLEKMPRNSNVLISQ
ncbi:cupin domain-containing protein [Synechococcus elongatus]|uniref:Cupin domain-containing protein n=1 Tax=Synechococcus elongatus PCC 11802 TaxID=2283154 RepID=A0AAT9JWR8_SYNEL|nr:cupin domain-containing protein [Synechococcus elongatus]QFZ91915.1 cupin domain-containing protein [Synechococcus elongatus PCC 11802]